MISASSAFAEQINSDVRSFSARFLYSGEEIGGDIKELTVNKGTGCDSAFTVGSLYSSYITATIVGCTMALQDKELELQFGVWLPDETIEYVTVGLYTVSEVATSAYSTTLTGIGRLSAKCGGAYKPNGVFPKAVSAVLADVTDMTGCSIDASAFPAENLEETVQKSMDGLLCREVLMYVAGLLGGFVTESNTGGIIIRPFSNTANATVDADRTTELYTFNDYDYMVSGVTVIVTEDSEDDNGNTVSGVSYSYGTPNLVLSNPYITQSLFNLMAPRVTGYAYRPGSIPITMGDIRLEADDVLTVTDLAGVSYTVPCLGIVHTYDGGLKTTVTAPGIGESQSAASFSGALQKAVEKTQAELVLAESLIAQKASITALNAVQATVQDLAANKADVADLSAANASIQNLEATKADVTDLQAANVEITNLNAADAALQTAVINKADIADLNATNANVGTLEADVANINNVLAGNVGTGDLQAIHITSDNVVIDDATITDAMIADLSAGKLTAGTIYTSLIKIASDQDENLLIDGSTIQIKDANGIVRVQIGKDAAGDYSYYLWDADGNLMWNPTGVTEAGLNAGIIKDIAIADDANINQSKIDMASVAERLNEDGSITVDSSHVTIDNTTLDVAYTTLANKVTEHGEATTTLQTELEVVQGQIESKIWQTDITEITDPLGQRTATLEDNYSTVNQTMAGIRTEVGAVKTKVDNLEIGSRNYIRNSETMIYDNYSFVSRGNDTTAYVGSAVVGTSTASGVVITAAQLNEIESNNATASTAIDSVKTTIGI